MSILSICKVLLPKLVELLSQQQKEKMKCFSLAEREKEEEETKPIFSGFICSFTMTQ